MLCHNIGDKTLETGFILSPAGKASTRETVMLITRIKVSIKKNTLYQKGIHSNYRHSVLTYMYGGRPNLAIFCERLINFIRE